MPRYHSVFLSNVTRLLVWPHSYSLEMKGRVCASAWDKWRQHCSLFLIKNREKGRERKKEIRNLVQSLWEPGLYALFTKRMSWQRVEGQMCALGLTCCFSGVMNILIIPSLGPTGCKSFHHKAQFLWWSQRCPKLQQVAEYSLVSMWKQPLITKQSPMLLCYSSLITLVFQIRLNTNEFCSGICIEQAVSTNFWGCLICMLKYRYIHNVCATHLS